MCDAQHKDMLDAFLAAMPPELLQDDSKGKIDNDCETITIEDDCEVLGCNPERMALLRTDLAKAVDTQTSLTP